MSLFTASSKRISENLAVLEQYCEDYNKLIRCINTAVLDSREENVTRRNIEEVNAKFKSLSSSIKDKLKLHADELSKYKEDELNHKLMKLHIRAHSRKLTEIVNRYRELQFIQKRNEEERLKMLYKIANRGCSEKEVQESVRCEGSNVKIESQYTLGSNSKKLCLEEADRRNTELNKIKDLAKELDELCRIILDTIMSKSFKIDNFADELIVTELNMTKANQELEKTLQRKIARKKFWRMVIFICCILLAVYFTYKCIKDDWYDRWKKNRS